MEEKGTMAANHGLRGRAHASSSLLIPGIPDLSIAQPALGSIKLDITMAGRRCHHGLSRSDTEFLR